MKMTKLILALLLALSATAALATQRVMICEDATSTT